MTTIAVTGATDGIGRATARRLLAAGHRVLVHARSEERGRPVVDALAGDGGGEAVLVTGDLASLAEVRGLAEQIRDAGGTDVLIHNAGVWVRGAAPRLSADGIELTLAVNVLAPHLLTGLLAEDLAAREGSRLLWLGSGMAAAGRPKPTALGGERGPRQAYADSKACDIALAMAWGRRLPTVASAAFDPGWVDTKLAGPGAPGSPDTSAETLAFCATEADLRQAPYWHDHAPTPVPGRLRDQGLQDAIAAVCDRMTGLAAPARS